MNEMQLGAHAEAIDTLKDEVKALREDVGEIKTMIAGVRATKHVLLAVGASAMTIGGLIIGGVSWLMSHTV